MMWQRVKLRLLVSLFLPVFLQAETSGVPTATTMTDQQVSATLQATETPPPQPQESDRKDGAGNAQALAMIGAAVAMGACAMMMAQAQQMPPGPEKTQMMSQAMQQCAQGAQNAANAGQNEKAKNAVTQNNSPKGEQQTAKAPTNAKNMMPPTSSSGSEEPSESGENLPNFNEPTLNDPTVLPEPGEIGNSFDPGTGFASGPSFSTPKSVESSEVGFNENNKGDEGRINPPGSGTFAGVGASGTLPDPNAKKEEGEGKNRRGGKGGEEEDGFTVSEGGSGSGGDGTAAGNATAFDKMLSDIMGGKQEPIPVLGSDSGILVLRNVGERKMTIFELATTRYKRAGYNEGLVDVRKPGRFRAPASIPKDPSGGNVALQ